MTDFPTRPKWAAALKRTATGLHWQRSFRSMASIGD